MISLEVRCKGGFLVRNEREEGVHGKYSRPGAPARRFTRIMLVHEACLGRRAAAALLAPLLVAAPPSVARADVKEEIRKAASVIPGYGPSDLLFPNAFRGRWKVTRSVVDVQYPLGKDKVPADEVDLVEKQLAAGNDGIVYEARFVETDDPGAFGDSVIPDRAFNAEQRESALKALPLDELEARWSSSNPNVVTMRNKRTGTVTETKVTKRSTETPEGGGAFGTSEYARVADAGSEGVLGGVPRILATRERARYRYSVTERGQRPTRIEALEIADLFDPTQTGFADLAGATPVLKVKARLTLDRVR